MIQRGVIVVAGGVGERAGKNIPKQFVPIANKPILVYSLKKFLDYDANIVAVVVCHSEFLQHCQNIVDAFFQNRNITIIAGGETRFHSVKNGLEYLKKINFTGIVAVHDAARPCVDSELIKRCFKTAEEYGNAIPTLPLSESIRELKNGTTTIADRSKFVIVQTPQCAKFSILHSAFQQVYQPIFTDEANVLEHYGEKIYTIDGDNNNIKITYPKDFEIAHIILQRQQYE